MDDVELLRLEYDQAAQLLRTLTEIRFKLLALVPTLAGAVVALVSGGRSGVELLAIGGLGLAASTGVLLYELRNGDLRKQAAARVVALETALYGQPLVSRRPTRRLFGLLPASHQLGVGLVYGAALGGWVYLVAWGALSSAGVGSHARSLGLALGAAAGAAVVAEVLRIEERRDERAAAATPAPSR